MDKLLIAGIDPGTRCAYALFDLEGNLVAHESFRNVSSDILVSSMRKHGRIVVVSSDVCPMPNLLKKISRQLGCRTIEPDHELKFSEKIRIVDTFLKTLPSRIKIENQHEKDALCAGLYGYKRINGLIKKIKDHLKEHDKHHLYDLVKEKVIVDKISISNAVKKLEE